MQLFCSAACFLFTSFTPLQASELGWSWCNLAPDRKRLFISLDACCLRYCLFPEPSLKSLKFLNSPSAQTARIFTRLSQWFLIGNNQMLNSRHLRSDEFFCRSPSCTTSLPELWSACYAAFLRSLTETFRGLNSRHLRSDEFFCRSPSCTASLPECNCACWA